MKTMKLLIIKPRNYGEKFIPDMQDDPYISSDGDINKISCCSSIYGCIRSQMIDIIGVDNSRWWVYSADVDVEKITKPEEILIEDTTFLIDEFWLMEPHEFTLIGEYIMKRSKDIDEYYGKYSFTKVGADEIIPEYDSLMHGDMYSFDFIGFDLQKYLQ